MGLDAIIAIAGLALPPLFDFIKKKFLKPDSDTPEATMSSLATTSPDVLPEYVKGMAQLVEAKVKWFNRDVVGQPSKWVVDVRAIIRPVGVIICFAMMAADGLRWLDLAVGVRYSCELVVSSWFGSRLTLKD